MTSSASLQPTALLMSPDFSEWHLCWPETQLCLSGMLLAQQTFVHVYSIVFFFLPYSLSFDLQKTGTFSGPDSQPSGCSTADVLKNQVDHADADNST